MSLERGPLVQGAQATAGNWQDAPFNRWAYWHVREILPTYLVSGGAGPVRELRPSAATRDLLGINLARVDGSAGTVGAVFADSFTDAYVVLQDGEVVSEWYGPEGTADRPHALMSVSKSVVGCVAAALIDRGQLSPDRHVTDYVPELAASGYAGATVRHGLDMRSGVRFVEGDATPQPHLRILSQPPRLRPH